MRGKIFLAAALMAGVICAAFFLYKNVFAPPPPEKEALALAEEKRKAHLFPHPDKTWYDMDIVLAADEQMIYGHTVLTTENTSGKNLQELWFAAYPNAFRSREKTPAPLNAYYAGFDDGWLKVEKVRVNGVTTVFVEKDVNILVILFEEIRKGEDIKIEMEWKAKVPRLAYRYGSQGGVFMLSNFYPALNVLDDRGWHGMENYPFGDPFYFHSANYRVKMRLPAAYEAAATGTKVTEEVKAEGFKEYFWEARNIRDFCLAALAGYEEIAGYSRIADLKVWVPAGKGKKAQEVLKEAASILDFYSSVFCSYPYEDFKIVFVPMQGFEGMEYSGLIFLQDGFLKNSFNEKRFNFILAHEIAHQWWYNLVGNNQIEEPWLDEGLADFSAFKYLSRVKGEPYAASRLTRKVNLDKGLKDMASRQDYYETAYYGGEAFWSGLEKIVGEEIVYNILKSYLAHYKYDIASREDLFYIIEMESKKDLAFYFDIWVKK